MKKPRALVAVEMRGFVQEFWGSRKRVSMKKI